MVFVIFHGAFGSPEGNWFPELRERLENLGQKVFSPQFPVDDESELVKKGPKAKIAKLTLKNWLVTFAQLKARFPQKEKLCFIGHSLGCVFILHLVSRFNLKLDSAIFVSPFFDALPEAEWPYNAVSQDFAKTDFDFERLRKSIPVSYVLYSDSDPYVSQPHAMLFAKAMESSVIFVKKAGHMNSEVNLNEFPLVLDLCLTRLDLTLFHRYLLLKQKLGAIEYIWTKRGQGHIKLEAKEAMEEGIFRFRNLQKGGFCTLFSGLSYFFQPHSQYMEDCRRAARRLKKRGITRVILAEKPSTLQNPSLREQIRADLAAGIRVYLCLYAKVKNKVIEPDWGIWDENYVCIVPFDKLRRVAGEITLDSRPEALEIAHEWRQEILKQAVEIHNSDKDVDNFIKLV